MAALTTAALIAAALGGAALGKALTPGAPKAPSLPDAPAAPDPNADQQQKQEILQMRAAQLAAAMGANPKATSGGTILTSGLGLADAAPTTRKTLLGQ